MLNQELLVDYRRALAAIPQVGRTGRICRLGGLSVEVEGLSARVGDTCMLAPHGGGALGGVLAEVVSARGRNLTVMPYGALDGLGVGSAVRCMAQVSDVPVGDALLGRVVDCFCRPLDGAGLVLPALRRALRSAPANPMERPRIHRPLATGVRCIDGLLALGQGQRMGIFAGSGVGKSTLLGMIARHVESDINVIALIGERGREVKEFIDKQLGPQGMARSVVVAAAADQPALSRLRAAYVALAISEHFRGEGRQVLLMLDSATRLAMARREVGLSSGEPPTARGYTPSVFTELPALCERCGTAASGGSITALMTVLVEGDDMNDPVADTMRAVLDGHIVLSRRLAHAGQYPAIDVLQSASRVMPDVVGPWQRHLAADCVRQLAVLERSRQMVDIGAYEPGGNPELDKALLLKPALEAWMRQEEGGVPPEHACQELARILGTPVEGPGRDAIH